LLVERTLNDMPDKAGDGPVIALRSLLKPMPQVGINRDRDLLALSFLRCHLHPQYSGSSRFVMHSMAG
jgi:hypothetical protein